MTDATLNAILRRIITEPDEDHHRLVYADRLDELCQPDRAEFVRVQVELATHIEQEVGGVRHYHKWTLGGRTVELERKERDLLLSTSSLDIDGFIRVRSHDYFGAMDNHKTAAYRRGLVESIKCDAETFLRHADALIWYETQTVGGSDRNCRVCRGEGTVGFGWTEDCGCVATKRPRPCPDTAQPIRTVTLTAWPAYEFNTQGRANINGRSSTHWVTRGEEHDHSQRGIAKTLCELEWPGVTFHLPTGTEAASDDEEVDGDPTYTARWGYGQ